jgi:hypothetical protein
VMLVGRFPAVFLFNLKGAYLSEGNYSSFLMLLAVILIFASTVFLYRETIYRWIARLQNGPEGSDQEASPKEEDGGNGQFSGSCAGVPRGCQASREIRVPGSSSEE